MRHPIWKKDDFFVVGNQRIDMDPAVVELPEQTSLSWGFDYNDARGPYGHVTDIRLEDGEITGELTVFDPTWDDNTLKDLNCRLGGFYNGVERKSDLDGSNAIVTKCILREVSIIMNPPYGANPFPKES